MSGGKAQTVIDSGAVWARFVPSGHIVYSGRGKLAALPFDLESLHYRWKGVRSPTLREARIGSFRATVLSCNKIVPRTRLVWVTLSGEEEPLAAPAGSYHTARLSPDGSRIALGYQPYLVEDPDWIYEIDRGTMTRVTHDPKAD